MAHQTNSPSLFGFREYLTTNSKFGDIARTTLGCIIVFVIGLFCFVVNRADPPKLFWDENYHITSAERYIEGTAQLEPHPPLGLLLLAASEALSRENAGIDKHILAVEKKINGDMLPPDYSFDGVRFLPSLFGAMGAVVFFVLAFELLGNRLHALFATSFYLFENAFIVHFRAAHLDSFQMFFSLCALWYFVKLWRSAHPIRAFQYGILTAFCTLAILVKLNAAALLLLLPLLAFKEGRKIIFSDPLLFIKKTGLKAALSISTAALLSAVVFYIHIAVAHLPPRSDTFAGAQDAMNMSPSYLNSLERGDRITPAMVIVAAQDYWVFMAMDHRNAPKLDAENPDENGSHPLLWPLHKKTINYRWDSADGKTSYVQLIGNQISWAIGLMAVTASAFLILSHRIFSAPLKGNARTYTLIESFLSLYVFFMLLNFWFITQRVMYLYHYFLGLVISYILAILVFRYAMETMHCSVKRRTLVSSAVSLIVFTSFIFFSPLTNHWPLTKEQCERRNILSHIVDCR